MTKITRVSAVLESGRASIDIPLSGLYSRAVNVFGKSPHAWVLSKEAVETVYSGNHCIQTNGAYWKIDCSDRDIGKWSVTAPLSLDVYTLSSDMTEMEISFSSNLAVFYFFNAKVAAPDSPILRNQVRTLISSGLIVSSEFARKSIFITVTVNQDDIASVERIIDEELAPLKKLAQALTPRIVIDYCHEDLFEFHALDKAWEMARLSDFDNTLILYFHGKGASHRNLIDQRNPREQFLTRIVVENWRLNYRSLILFPGVQKLGFMAGGNGWLWYNFWWARSDFIRSLERPVVTDRRHYYEDWLGRCVQDQADGYVDTIPQCFGIASNPSKGIFNIGSSVNADVASAFCASAAGL